MVTPSVLVTKQAVNDMVVEVLSHPNIETAWGLFGLLMDDGAVIVTGVLRPSETDVVRRYATAQLGGEHQASAVRWLSQNYQAMRKQGLTKASGRFAFLYKGHSHHVLGVDQYSGTDTASILEAVEVDGLKVAVGPLATLAVQNPSIRPSGRYSGTLVITQGQRVWLRFYYLDQAMVAQGQRAPILVTPTVVDVKDVPVLPPLGWQFVREDDYLEQLRHLRNYGCSIEIVLRDITDGPPYEIQFIVQKPNWRAVLSIVTTWDYPRTPPKFQVLPVGDRAATETDDYAGAAYLLEGPLWNPGEDLLEGLFRLEARGEL